MLGAIKLLFLTSSLNYFTVYNIYNIFSSDQETCIERCYYSIKKVQPYISSHILFLKVLGFMLSNLCYRRQRVWKIRRRVCKSRSSSCKWKKRIWSSFWNHTSQPAALADLGLRWTSSRSPSATTD